MYDTYLVETSQDMRQVHNRITMFVYLVENIVAEQSDNIPVTRLGPPHVAGKPTSAKSELQSVVLRKKSLNARQNILRPFIDKSKFAEKPHKAAILELTHKLAFQAVCGPVARKLNV